MVHGDNNGSGGDVMVVMVTMLTVKMVMNDL